MPKYVNASGLEYFKNKCDEEYGGGNITPELLGIKTYVQEAEGDEQGYLNLVWRKWSVPTIEELIGWTTVTTGVTSSPAGAPFSGGYMHYYTLNIRSGMPCLSKPGMKIFSGQHKNGYCVPSANFMTAESDVFYFHFVSNIATVSQENPLYIYFHAWC